MDMSTDMWHVFTFRHPCLHTCLCTRPDGRYVLSGDARNYCDHGVLCLPPEPSRRSNSNQPPPPTQSRSPRRAAPRRVAPRRPYLSCLRWLRCPRLLRIISAFGQLYTKRIGWTVRHSPYTCLYPSPYACLHTCRHTCPRARLDTCLQACLHTYLYTCLHTYLHQRQRFAEPRARAIGNILANYITYIALFGIYRVVVAGQRVAEPEVRATRFTEERRHLGVEGDLPPIRTAKTAA